VTHTVTSTDLAPAFDSGGVAPGTSYSFTFSNAGSFPYTCSIHPTMTGTITVMP
jgi:plastocyanin